MIDCRLILTLATLAGLCCCSAGAPAPEPADEVREALIRDLRIGFVRPSGDVVWPVETLEEPRRFALPLWSEERQARRRIWRPDLQPDPKSVVKGRLRLSVGTTVDVLHDGRTYRAVIEGFTVLQAGCGEWEPGWRAQILAAHRSQDVDRDSGGLDDPALWRSPYTHMEPSPFPVLVGLGGPPLQPPVTATDDELPPGLLVALADRELLEGERRSLRTGPFWTVYGARTIDDRGRKVGSFRSVWRETGDGYQLVAEDATNPTFEEMITKWVDPDRQSYNFDSAVGQVHAMLDLGERVFYLSRYKGWESELVFVEELRPDRLERVLHDGLDRGC